MNASERLGFPVFGRGEWDGFLTLVTDNLAKIVILPAILMGALHLPEQIVYGRILAGLGLTLFIGQMGFVYSARRLARRTGRSDITALPYGISTPSLFVFLFGIMGPVYAMTNSALIAYQVGLAGAFVGGLVKLGGAFIAPLISRITPQAGLLGTLAGVALIWIAMVPAAIIFGNPLIGLPCLFIVLIGLAGNYRFPFRLPTGLVVVAFGALLGLLTRETSLNLQDIAFRAPVPVAGDDYHILPNMLWNGFGTCLAAVFGSPFPTTVYIGHPANKRMGARVGYTIMSGTFLLVAGLTGIFALLQHLIPVAAISTLLVFIGLVMTQYAFQAVPPAYGIAIAIAVVPHIADLLKKQLDGTFLEILPASSITAELGARLASNQGVYLQSYALLAHGAILVGLLWGSIVACIIDGRLLRAAGFTTVAFLLSLVGLIHAGSIGLALSPITWGYLIVTGMLVVLGLPAAIRQRAARAQPAGGEAALAAEIGS